MFTSSVRREIGQFQVVVVQRRQGNVQKRVMHVQSCCFANLNLLLFCRSHCRRRRRRRRRRRSPVPPHHLPPPPPMSRNAGSERGSLSLPLSPGVASPRETGRTWTTVVVA